MNVGFVSTRLGGTDGVSLETDQLAVVLKERLQHDVFYCAGELGATVDGLEAPELHFNDPVAQALNERAFTRAGEGPALIADIATRAQ